MIRAVMGACALLLAAAPARARDDQTRPPQLRGVDFEQRLGAQVPLELPFRDEAGRRVRLGDYFHDRPVILVLAYYRCPMLCTRVLNGLVRTMLDLDFNAGREFEVVTVSFDPRETPPLAAAKKKSYLERYGRPGAEDGWHFLTGEEASIKALTENVGFHYTYDAKNDQFAHPSGIMVLTPGGKISKYFYDIKYSKTDLRLGLVEASENRIGSPVDKILLFCFHYDPSVGRYGVVIMNVIRLGGVLTILGIGTLVGFLWVQERRRARRTARTAG